MLIRRAFAVIALTAPAALTAAPASADTFYRVTGDLFDDTPTQVGTFQIDIDPNDLTIVVTNAALDPGSQLAIEPWYGYDVLAASVTIDGFTWTGADVVAADLPFGGPSAQFWIEGAAIAELDTEDFSVDFTELGGAIALIGRGTGSADQVLNNEIDWSSPNSSGGGNASTGGGYQNVVVTFIPEPTSLALLSLGGLIVARRRQLSF